jgi:hypothetical protein
MLAVRPGHYYTLESFEGRAPQFLQFIEKERRPDPSGSADVLVTVNDGTTNEEVLRVLIDRMNSLHKKVPSRESAIVITKLEECLMWLEKRTADRKLRGVEGTPIP